uniref:Uncharacterized protein n=1 Tax=Trieres chinensis TaxID=1514140 RepID=A0A7S2A9I1_TRICV|mmetsp:Transcript_8304/g.17598  ORF Transcript_8304/g.17598 Transcript_8304/m.17598 type:complete len:108 (+) Transcript_8304:698-1021(+)
MIVKVPVWVNDQLASDIKEFDDAGFSICGSKSFDNVNHFHRHGELGERPARDALAIGVAKKFIAALDVPQWAKTDGIGGARVHPIRGVWLLMDLDICPKGAAALGFV